MMLSEYTGELCHDYVEWYVVIYHNGEYLFTLQGGTPVQLCVLADQTVGRVVQIDFNPYALQVAKRALRHAA